MSVVIGVVLCELAAFTLALAMNVQRFALSVEDQWFENKKYLTRNRIWVIGLMIYALANLFYFVGLSFAPLSLMSALFATLLIFNAVLARYLLGERLSQSGSLGLAIILCGVATLGFFGPTESAAYNASDIGKLFGALSGYGFLIAMLSVLTLLAAAIWEFEVHYPSSHLAREGNLGPSGDGGAHGEKVPRHLALIMLVLYPSMLGLCETLVQISLKAISCMLLVSARGESQLAKPMFWGALVFLCVSMLLTVWWLGRVYERYATTDGLPIEYGVVTLFSVLAGLIVFQELKFTDETDEMIMAGGICMILVGIFVSVVFKASSVEEEGPSGTGCTYASQKVSLKVHATEGEIQKIQTPGAVECNSAEANAQCILEEMEEMEEMEEDEEDEEDEEEGRDDIISIPVPIRREEGGGSTASIPVRSGRRYTATPRFSFSISTAPNSVSTIHISTAAAAAAMVVEELDLG
jgi:drug/metabolite transporter (DMT)-like permease